MRIYAWTMTMTLLFQGLGIQAGERTAAKVEIFPVVLTGSTAPNRFFYTEVHLMNLSTTTSEVTVLAFTGGEPDPILQDGSVAVSVKRIALEPEEAVRLPLRYPPEANVPDLRESWLAVRTESGFVNSSLRLAALVGDSGGQARSVSDILTEGVPPSPRWKAFITWEGSGMCFPHIQSAYAFVNPSRNRTAHLRLRFLMHADSGPDRLFESRMEIPPLGRRTALLANLFEELFPPPNAEIACPAVVVREEGILNVSSDLHVAVEAFDVNLSTGHFFDLAVEPLRQKETQNSIDGAQGMRPD